MTQKALLQSAGDGTAVPTGYVGEQLVQIWTGVTIGTTDTSIATHSNVSPGIYLFIVETDCTKNASTTRITSGFIGTATYNITKRSEGGDYCLFANNTNGAGIYATYYARVTSSGTVTFISRSLGAVSTGSRGSFSIVRIA